MDFSAEMLASRIRRFRYNKRLSIEQLAQKAKVDKNTIVRIEKGEGRPNLKTLINICNVLEESVDKLVDMNAHENKDFYVHRRKKSRAKGQALKKQKGFRLGDLVAKLPFGHMNVVILEIDGNGQMRSHPGEEILFCLKGKVGINLGNTSVTLKKGDSVMFFGREPHQYYNADKSKNPVTAVGLSVWLDEDIDPQSNYFETYHL
ncbi:MAG: helix-turn-helix domain-containing protein [Candidatus Glassbacteria bacterium]|nr:helix-turn-helix domain-containing protein [Candidatus Glassbacteria bacterium]